MKKSVIVFLLLTFVVCLSGFSIPGAGGIQTSGGGAGRTITNTVTLGAWIRPTDWLEPTTPPDGTQAVYATISVASGTTGNYVSFSASGAYTVDWGDGSAAENFVAGAQADHQYTHSAISAATELGGGIRQVMLTVTPQAGNNLTVFAINKTHPSQTAAAAPYNAWQELSIRSSELTTLTLTGMKTLRTVFVHGANKLSAGASMFNSLPALQIASLTTSTLSGSINSMFNACGALQEVPTLDLTGATTANLMFNGCYGLTSAPVIINSNLTDTSQMFSGCSSLQSVTLFDMSKAATTYNMFLGCTALKQLPLLDFSASTGMGNVFNACSALITIPLFNTAKSTTFQSTFSGCTSLVSVPLLNTASATTFLSMFSGCTALKTVPAFNSSRVTDFNTMFNGCVALTEVPALNMASATTATNMFATTGEIRKVDAYGMTRAWSVATNKLDATALNTLFTNLGTAVSSGTTTITVTGNPGTGTADLSIATAKGWVVVP